MSSTESITLAPGQSPPEGANYVLVQVDKSGKDAGTISHHSSGVTFICGNSTDDLHHAVNDALDYAEKHGFERIYIQPRPNHG